jgi:pimeloyl-ACP methyl ester carboxylesterase
VPAADAAQLVRAWARAPGFAAARRAMRAGYFTGLKRVDVPVTLVWPEHDRLVRRPRSLPDNVRSVELADAGHVAVWDAPDELAAILLEVSAASRV